MIVFSNPGLIDVRCITVQGINVKPETKNPIGAFGTGLKVAIAVLLRTGHTIDIYSGAVHYFFTTTTESVRGTDFQFINMHTEVYGESRHGHVLQETHKQLGFTTDLGKHWETWMAYRELWSNCKDEGGNVDMVAKDQEPMPNGNAGNWTCIRVSGPEISLIHVERGRWFLTTEPLWENDDIAIHAKQDKSANVFYQGILAGVFDRNPAFTYNIKRHMALTEDRTFNNIFEVKHIVSRALLKCDEADLLSTAFENSFEFGLDYDWPSHDLGPVIESLAMERIKTKKTLPVSLRSALRRVKGKDFDKETLDVPETLLAMLLAEPTVEPATVSRSSIFAGVYAMEEQITQLTAQNLYWRTCIEKLAKAEEAKASTVTSLAAADSLKQEAEETTRVTTLGEITDKEIAESYAIGLDTSDNIPF